jgi:spore coat polysaccharide biosynthesis protein SpsF (cytidylyltransferase family)
MIIAIIQARLNSKRLPYKVLKKIYKNMDILDILIKKLSTSKFIDKIYIATGSKKNNFKIKDKEKYQNVKVIFGSNKNVASRFIKILKISNAKYFVRITADNPFTDINLMEKLIRKIKKQKLSYIYYDEKTIPLGTGTEVLLSKYFINWYKYFSSMGKEHVTFDLKKLKKSIKIKEKSKFFPLKLTVDTFNDFNFIRYLYCTFGLSNYTELSKKIIKYK